MDTRIYVMTHKEYTKPDDDMYISMHVGHALGNEFGYLADDSGDNISSKNRNYCELTGMYWIWKNVKCDIVGICHYRRYFLRDNSLLSKQYIEEVLKEYDIIVPNSGCTQYKSNMDHYANVHKAEDMVICRSVVEEKYPEYLTAFDLCMNTNLASLGNMVITRKEIYDAYCMWLFDILFEVEYRVDIREYDTFQARIFGYLSERLFRVWMMANGHRIREEEVRMLDVADLDTGRRQKNLSKRYIELLLHDMTEQYRIEKMEDIVDLSPFEIDFQGKIPVFICCFQGYENASKLEKNCIARIDQLVPADLAEVHLITFENLGMYITLPEWVIEKYENGLLPRWHLLQIVSMALLYRYGGLWINSTYYVSKEISRDIFEKNIFYTIKKDNSSVVWDKGCIYLPPVSIFARYLLNALFEYWKQQEKLITENLIDCITEIACEKIPQIKEMFDNCPVSNPQTDKLDTILNCIYDKALFDEICSDTNIFRLTEKDGLQSENLVGKQTVYGYLIGS